MKDMPIIATFDDRFIELAEICFKSLLHHNSNLKLHIISSNLSQRSRDILLNLDKNIIFLKTPKSQLNVIDWRKYNGRWIKDLLNKIEFINMPEFEQYEKAIFIDTDTLFTGNIAEVFETYPKNGNYLAAVQAIDTNLFGHKMDTFPKLLEYGARPYNSGFQIYDLKKMREDDIYLKCINVALTTTKENLGFNEEDMLYTACFPYISQLPVEEFIMSQMDRKFVKGETKFIHYIGEHKPNNSKECDFRDIWHKYKNM
jgi:lipopolysaccharide biosynthesis glycosyltransferase